MPVAYSEQMLLQLGVPPEAIKADLAERQDQWQHHIHARRMLIVLDNTCTSDEQLSIPVDLLGGCRLGVLVGAFDELAGHERGAGADEGDEMRCVDRAPAVLRGLDELERHREPSRA